MERLVPETLFRSVTRATLHSASGRVAPPGADAPIQASRDETLHLSARAPLFVVSLLLAASPAFGQTPKSIPAPPERPAAWGEAFAGTYADAQGIHGFVGDYKFLSNFYPCRIVFGGLVYNSAEAIYQSCKFPPSEREIYTRLDAAAAKKLAHSKKIDEAAWDARKDDVMRQALWAKFSQNRTLAFKLLATGNRTLEETNGWDDEYWGVFHGRGKNTLGLMLMEVRARLASGGAALTVPAPRADRGAPTAGDPVDLSAWAYGYAKGAPGNPPETQWLWPHKTLRWERINGSLVWYYDDSSHVLPKGEVLAGLLWEEPRPVQRVEASFPARAGHVPQLGEVIVAARPAASMWEDHARVPPYSAVVAEEVGHPTVSADGATVFSFNLGGVPVSKVYVIYTGDDSQVAAPTLHAYSKTHWRAEETLDAEWQTGPGRPLHGGVGRIEAYNGRIDGIAPLVSTGGPRHGIQVRFSRTDDPANSRTLLTFHTGAASFTLAARDLDDGPVVLPSLGVHLSLERSEATAGGVWIGAPAPGGATRPEALFSAARVTDPESVSGRAAPPAATTREQVERLPEESWQSAMRRYFGDRSLSLPPIPAPPYDTPMTIDVPERQLAAQWRLGAWHLSRWSQKQPDGSYAVSIWPYDKSLGGNEGTVALGSETFLILRTLDMLGVPDIAEGGLNYWLFGAHAQPYVWDAQAMGGDALTDPYNSPNRRSPGYDQKHSLGHGRILAAAAFHYRMTRDASWWRRAEPVLQRACEATIRLRDAWDATQPAGAWSHGLIPPGNISDNNNTRLFYGLSACYYEGLRDAGSLLAAANYPGGSEDVRAAADFRADLLRAVDRSLALTQVVKVDDGTYRRDFSFMPYIRGLAFDIDNGPQNRNSQYYDSKMGSLTLVDAGVISANDPVVSDMLDVYEDRLVSDGQNDQNGYNVAPKIYLERDDVPMFLRGMYNGYAAEIAPDSGYTFWEAGHHNPTDAADKTFEEAGFLRNVRLMLVMEDGGSLWLARGTPRAWLAQGQHIAIAHAPTVFGEVAYRIDSDVAHGRISAALDLPTRNPPELIYLKLRHPTAAKIKSVTVDGKPWPEFDPERELVILRGLSGPVTVTAHY